MDTQPKKAPWELLSMIPTLLIFAVYIVRPMLPQVAGNVWWVLGGFICLIGVVLTYKARHYARTALWSLATIGAVVQAIS